MEVFVSFQLNKAVHVPMWRRWSNFEVDVEAEGVPFKVFLFQL